MLFVVSDFALSQSAFLVYRNGSRAGHVYNTAERNTLTLAYDVYSRSVSVSTLLRRIADVLLLIALVELGNGLLFAYTRQRRRSQKILRWFTISSGATLVILAITHTCLANTVMREQWYATFELRMQGSSTDPSSYDISYFESLIAQSISYRRLEGAYNVLSFFTAVGALVYASVTMHFYASVKPSRIVCISLLESPFLSVRLYIND